MGTPAQRWTDYEFTGLDLAGGLNKRTSTLIERFVANPEATIPAASDGWSETVAEHRFLGNTDMD